MTGADLRRAVRPFVPARIRHLLRFPLRRRIFRRVRRAYEGRPHGLVVGDTNHNFYYPRWVTLDRPNSFADFEVDLACGGLPLPDQSIRYVYASHVLEHIDDKSALQILCECRRIMRPDGVIRIVVPDADLFIETYQRGDTARLVDLSLRINDVRSGKWERVIETWGVPRAVLEPHNLLVRIFASYHTLGFGPVVEKAQVDKNLGTMDREEFIRWCGSLMRLSPDEQGLASCTHPAVWEDWGGHVNGYTYRKLVQMLSEAGFRSMTRSEFRQSQFSEMKGPQFDLEIRRPISLYVEGAS